MTILFGNTFLTFMKTDRSPRRSVVLKHPCAIFFLAMAKSALLHGQTESSPWPENSLCVISYSFWRQLYHVLASIKQSIDANIHDWPRRGNNLATGRICLATGGFGAGHRTNRSLVGEGIDFDRRRNGLAPVTEMFGARPFKLATLN